MRTSRSTKYLALLFFPIVAALSTVFYYSNRVEGGYYGGSVTNHGHTNAPGDGGPLVNPQITGGSSTFTFVTTIATGSASQPAYGWSTGMLGTSKSGMYGTATGGVAFSNNGASVWTIDGGNAKSFPATDGIIDIGDASHRVNNIYTTGNVIKNGVTLTSMVSFSSSQLSEAYQTNVSSAYVLFPPKITVTPTAAGNTIEITLHGTVGFGTRPGGITGTGCRMTLYKDTTNLAVNNDMAYSMSASSAGAYVPFTLYKVVSAGSTAARTYSFAMHSDGAYSCFADIGDMDFSVKEYQ